MFQNGGAGPTFEDLSIDDSIPPFERCIRYCRSKIGLQRLVHVQMIASVAEEVGFEKTCDSLIPLLENFLGDAESPIRQACAEQVALLAKFCKITSDCSDEKGYELIITHLLPLCAQFLEDDKPEVRQAAGSCLVEIAKLLKREDLGPHVLTIVLALAHDDEKEEMRMTASELLNQLAEWLGEDLCKQFVIPEVVSLAEDPVFRVRKSTALNFQNVCKVGGEHELFERLMPAYVRLSKDEMYRVRRACAESLADVSRHVSDDIRIGVLVEIFLRLAQDSSPLVKQSILHQSGVFIATLPRRAITETILNHFCSMATGATGNIGVDAELKQQCAFTFPAVLRATGRSRWLGVLDETEDFANSQLEGDHGRLSVADSIEATPDDSSSVAGDSDIGSNFGSNFGSQMGSGKERHDSMTTIGTLITGGSVMKETYMTLIASRNVAVKQTLALSLHGVASILAGLEVECFDEQGLPVITPSPNAKRPERSVVEEELATVFEELIQDVEVVQIGVITNLACFLELLTVPCRASYLPILPDILHSTNPFNWRLRQSLARQLPDLVLLPNPDALVAPLFPLVMALLQDPVAAVRRDSYRGTARMLSVLYGGQKRAAAGKEVAAEESFRGQVAHVAAALNRLSGAKVFQQRQLWLELCVELLKELPRELFESYFVSGIVLLASDPVVNVRLVVSELFASWDAYLLDKESGAVGMASVSDPTSISTESIASTPWEWFLAREDIKECVAKLARDDFDVYRNIKRLAPLFPNIDFQGVRSSCMRDDKTEKGGKDEGTRHAVEETGNPDASVVAPADPASDAVDERADVGDTPAVASTEDEDVSPTHVEDGEAQEEQQDAAAVEEASTANTTLTELEDATSQLALTPALTSESSDHEGQSPTADSPPAPDLAPVPALALVQESPPKDVDNEESPENDEPKAEHKMEGGLGGEDGNEVKNEALNVVI